MITKGVFAKTILSKSKVFDYTINPYIGCEHGCTYCYARFMKRFTGHKEHWGEFVDVKINAASLLQHEITRKRVGRVWVSGMCDAYQPIEKKYELTRRCLEILLEQCWPVTIQTKSPLVSRDIELLKQFKDVEVGLTITTADENLRKIFEPDSSPIRERIQTVEKLHFAGIKTFVMIAPMLPKAEGLAARLGGRVDYVLVDRMNYHYADWVYRKHELEYAMSENFLSSMKRELGTAFRRERTHYQFLF